MKAVGEYRYGLDPAGPADVRGRSWVAPMRSGFALVDVGIAILLVGVMLMACIPGYVSSREAARVARVKDNMHIVQIALEAWAVDHNSYFPDADGEPFCLSEDSLDIRPWFPGGDPFGASGRPVYGRLPTNPYTALSYNDPDNGVDMDLLYGEEWLGQADGPGRVADGASESSMYRNVANPTMVPGLIGVACYARDGVHVNEYGIVGYSRDPAQPISDENPNPAVRIPTIFVLHN